jgi:hypothetical protein
VVKLPIVFFSLYLTSDKKGSWFSVFNRSSSFEGMKSTYFSMGLIFMKLNWCDTSSFKMYFSCTFYMSLVWPTLTGSTAIISVPILVDRLSFVSWLMKDYDKFDMCWPVPYSIISWLTYFCNKSCCPSLFSSSGDKWLGSRISKSSRSSCPWRIYWAVSRFLGFLFRSSNIIKYRILLIMS